MNTRNSAARHPFHPHAISWLREKMHVETETLPTNAVADPDDPTRAVIHGHVVTGGRRDSGGFAALLLLILAACSGMVTARPNLDETLVLALWSTAGALCLAAIGLIVFEVRRANRARLAVAILVRGRAAAASPISSEEIERWAEHDGVDRWVVSETGFAPDALAVARARKVRCFESNASVLVEVSAA